MTSLPFSRNNVAKFRPIFRPTSNSSLVIQLGSIKNFDSRPRPLRVLLGILSLTATVILILATFGQKN